ncbi:hypothetical protein COB55_03945 [Candidatus Wolfebacteria bacterium]|nr:MAG: hypothetical protein COB55_03945 [Candidatus Wolfebacteria bacterium]
MIVEGQIFEITVRANTLKYYNDLGYGVKIAEKLPIPTEHLSKGSHVKIKCSCDICGNPKETIYRDYLQSFNNGGKYCCSTKCNQFKNKITNLERHGVENIFQSEIIKDKIKQTNLKNFGVEHNSQREGFGDMVKQTKLENHGDENFNNNQKAKETTLERHGDENYRNMEKSRQTKLENHGDENYVNIEKMKQTNLKNLGVEFPFQSEKIQYKCRQTCFENHGVKNPFQIPEIIDTIFETRWGLTHDEYLESLPDFKLYRNRVLFFTRKQPTHLLENIEKRSNYDHHLDHMFTIYEGFKQNICPYIIGNIINLEMLTSEDNRSKHIDCSQTKEQLFEKYDNRQNLLEQLIKDYNKKQSLII